MGKRNIKPAPNAMVNGCCVLVAEMVPPPALIDLTRLVYPLVFDPPNSNSPKELPSVWGSLPQAQEVGGHVASGGIGAWRYRPTIR
jgi:hypothetical protein